MSRVAAGAQRDPGEDEGEARPPTIDAHQIHGPGQEAWEIRVIAAAAREGPVPTRRPGKAR